MYAYDFEYDGKMLSSFGFIICSFGDGDGVGKTETGSEITFITSPIQDGKRVVTGGTKYEKCLSTSFQICKDPSFFNRRSQKEMEISADEFRTLSRWLNRRKFLWFKANDWCDPDTDKPWVRASFTLNKIDVDRTTYGIELDMVTDSPFCYGDETVKTFEFENANDTVLFIDNNDEIGETYPELTITCGAAGTLTLSDDRTGCECTIENCVSGEVIHFSGDTKIIDSSSTTHDIANDFNYDYFRFGNTHDDRENIITASMPCTVEMKYRPIRKDTL